MYSSVLSAKAKKTPGSHLGPGVDAFAFAPPSMKRIFSPHGHSGPGSFSLPCVRRQAVSPSSPTTLLVINCPAHCTTHNASGWSWRMSCTLCSSHAPCQRHRAFSFTSFTVLSLRPAACESPTGSVSGITLIPCVLRWLPTCSSSALIAGSPSDRSLTLGYPRDSTWFVIWRTAHSSGPFCETMSAKTDRPVLSLTTRMGDMPSLGPSSGSVERNP